LLLFILGFRLCGQIAFGCMPMFFIKGCIMNDCESLKVEGSAGGKTQHVHEWVKQKALIEYYKCSCGKTSKVGGKQA